MMRLFGCLVVLWSCFTAPLIARCHQCADIYSLGRPDLPCGEISYINGMYLKPHKAQLCALMLSDEAGGYNVYTVYNPSNGIVQDLRRIFQELFDYEFTAPVHYLHVRWDCFFDACENEEELYLQFCHSQGTIQVRNALYCYDPELRKRIIVVAIAPAAYVPDEICYHSYHYISEGDMIPILDKGECKWCCENTVFLKPRVCSQVIDHRFMSPTFRPVIRCHLRNYVHSVFELDEKKKTEKET